MASYNWQYSKLPKNLHQEAITAYEEDNIKVMMKLHNDYKLSPVTYCCGCDDIMRKFWKIGIEQKLIAA